MRRTIGYILTFGPFVLIIGLGIYTDGLLAIATLLAILILAGSVGLGLILLTRD